MSATIYSVQTFAPRVFPRGNPEPSSIVHAYVPPSRDGCHKEKPKCGNGAYHIWMSSDPAKVTCAECLKKSTP